MAAINSCKILVFDHSLSSSSNSQARFCVPVSAPHYSQFFGPNLFRGWKSFTLRRLSVSYRRYTALQQFDVVPRVSCLLEESSEDCSRTPPLSESNNSQQEATIDLKLPRRSLLVTFTCDACGARSQRLINRLAYERGLVYVQCAGCAQYHKLVDNLGLVIEYNLKGESDLDASGEQL